MIGRLIASTTLCFTIAGGAAAVDPLAQASGQTIYLPVESISYEFGSKTTSGYFVREASACSLVLLVSEKSGLDSVPATSAARLRLTLNPGQVAGLDSAEGQSLNFTCGADARLLLVDAGDMDKLAEMQRAAMQAVVAQGSLPTAVSP
jgi:hypothetical protein